MNVKLRYTWRFIFCCPTQCSRVLRHLLYVFRRRPRCPCRYVLSHRCSKGRDRLSWPAIYGANVCFQIAWTIWAVLWAAWTFITNGDDPVTEARSDEKKAGAMIIIGLVLLTGLLPVRQLWRATDRVRQTALIVTIAGLALAVYGRICLGSKWAGCMGETPDTSNRVISGAYALLDHPIYTGVGIAAIATAIGKGDLGSIAGGALLASALGWKTEIEGEVWQ